MKQTIYRLFLAAICASVLLAGCEPRPQASDRTTSEVTRIEGLQQSPIALPQVPALQSIGPDEGNNSMQDVTAHITFAPYSALLITRPVEDITLQADHYYITGVSDPEQPLLLDDEEVEHRGELGSFGVYVELEEGENIFTFTQGGVSAVVTINNEEADAAGYSLTDTARNMRPEWDAVARAGEEYLLSCIAPSGARVTAAVDGQTVELEQSAATAVEAVPATFLAYFTPNDRDGTSNLGNVVYTLEFNGEITEHPSVGELFVVGSSSPLLVQGVNVSATVFAEESEDSSFYTALSQGAVDEVVTIGTSMYELAMGGWVVKDAVMPLTDRTSSQNTVQQAAHVAGESRDTVVLAGSSPAPYRAEWGSGSYQITLFRTTGVGEIAVEGSSILESITVSEVGGNTTLTFRPKQSVEMGGYLVTYDGDNTVIAVRPRPRLTEGAYPLLGVTVVLDPGHGGDDIGASGVARDEGPRESEINLETARAVRQYLRGLGATVVMTREDDMRVDMNERLEIIRHPDVDIAISLHSNSVESYLDGTRPSGTETYYFDPATKDFATALNDALCAETGRDNRGAKHANFKATLNAYVPTVMVEMGFLTNPEEYDSLCSRQGIYALSRGIGEGILAALK